MERKRRKTDGPDYLDKPKSKTPGTCTKDGVMDMGLYIKDGKYVDACGNESKIIPIPNYDPSKPGKGVPLGKKYQQLKTKRGRK